MLQHFALKDLLQDPAVDGSLDCWCVNHLVTGLTAGLQSLSVVPAAVDLSVLVEVDQINQQLAAGDALETLRVPTTAVTRPTGKHSYVSTADLPATLGK